MDNRRKRNVYRNANRIQDNEPSLSPITSQKTLLQFLCYISIYLLSYLTSLHQLTI